MMSVVTLIFSVVILASTVAIAQSKGINSGDIAQSKGINSGDIKYGDTVPVVIEKSEVTNLRVERTSHNEALNENISDLPPVVDIQSDNNTEEVDRVQAVNQHVDVDSVRNQIYLDGNNTLEEEAKVRENPPKTSEDGEGEAFLDEELQQDLPDIWSDTGQFLPDILDNPIRLEEDPSTSLGIKVGSPSEEEAVECPPPVILVTPSLCGAPACLTHRHCRDPETACCFNGCVHTCLRPLDAPAVIDWLEDTSLILPMLDEAPGVPRYPMLFEGSSSIAYAQGGGEAVHLQGGCTITSQQYDQLKDYMTRSNIQDCSCTGGEVVCVVKPYKREEE